MKAFVAGATGGTGKEIVKQLVQRGIPVKAMVRDRTKGEQLLPSEVELVIGDVSNLDSLRQAMSGCSVVLCATGAAPSLDLTGPFRVDFVGTKNLIAIAKEQQVQQFVIVSSLCVSNFFHPLNLFWLVLFWKKQAEGYLQQSGLPYTIVRPGGLKSEDNTDAIIMSEADSLVGGSIPRAKVAQVCIESLFQPAAANKIVEIVAQPNAAAQPFETLFANV
jgi:uncharacterized protein YbjT (DUF2867 family)